MCASVVCVNVVCVTVPAHVCVRHPPNFAKPQTPDPLNKYIGIYDTDIMPEGIKRYLPRVSSEGTVIKEKEPLWYRAP